MKVRISYTVDVDDDTRRAINEHYGRDGLATRDEIRRWYENVGRSMDDDLSNNAPEDQHRDPWEGTESWDAIE